ncbi:uncharacterized protein LOC127585771 isoform X3 [Pristis pectinata]|uniref:uncharacterized protein LOC127585771 isoform X3 n=1 Tax=Pristis pectinata TaxID=685728 RepID=UPI00223DCD79|nr:uncharacterized protein LOC127585771 isoform X3 [Pristis pectinata]
MDLRLGGSATHEELHLFLICWCFQRIGSGSWSRWGLGRSGTRVARNGVRTDVEKEIHSGSESPGPRLSCQRFSLGHLFLLLLLRVWVIGAEGRRELVGALGSSVLLDPEVKVDPNKNEIIWTFIASHKSPVTILHHIPGYLKWMEPSEQFKTRLQFIPSNGSLMVNRLEAGDQGAYSFTVDGQQLKIIQLLLFAQYTTEVYRLPGSSVAFLGVDENARKITKVFYWEKLQEHPGKEPSVEPVLEYHVGSMKPFLIQKYNGRIDFSPSNGSLVFNDLTYADDGLYRLSINLRATIIRTVRLRIMDKLSKPSIWSNASSPGSTIQLMCNVGDASSYQWWKDGREVSHHHLQDGNRSLVIPSASRSDCGNYTCVATNPVRSVQASYLLTIHGLRPVETVIVVASIVGIVSPAVSFGGLLLLCCLRRELMQASLKQSKLLFLLLFICNNVSLVAISIALIFWIVIKGAASVPVVALCIALVLLAFNVCPTINIGNLGCKCISRFLDSTGLRASIDFCGIISSFVVIVFSIVILVEEIQQSNEGCYVTILIWSILPPLFTVLAVIFIASAAVWWKGNGDTSSKSNDQGINSREKCYLAKSVQASKESHSFHLLTL